MSGLCNFNGLASWRDAEKSLESVNLTMPARAVFKVERLSRRAAVLAGKAVSPAGFLQVGGAGRIIGEKSLELG